MPDLDADPDADYDDLDGADDTPLFRKLRRDLKAATKRAAQADEYEARLASLEQEQTFRAAGLDGLNERQMKALRAAHEGDMTADAIRATAVELGFAQPPEPAVSQEQQAAHERIDAAGAGAQPPPPTNVLAELDNRTMNEDEFWRKAASLGVTTGNTDSAA